MLEFSHKAASVARMETKDWLLFVGPVLGILIGGLIGIGGKWFEQRQVDRSQLRQIKLARLEELHDLVMRYPIIWVEALREQYSEKPSDAKSSVPITFLQPPVGRVDLIVHLYFPELTPQLVKLEKLERELTREWSSASRSMKDLKALTEISIEHDSSQRLQIAKPLIKKFTELDNHTATFLQGISKISRDIVS